MFEVGENVRVPPVTHPGFNIINTISKAIATGGEDPAYYLTSPALRLEAGSVRQRRRAKTGPTAAPCTTITAALLSPCCMQVAVSMEKPPGSCFVFSTKTRS